ncbi:M56 family metallopeptidase [Saccharothrix deserti]|uniref:M56 family metallopeptidase n=1 Tax=Saccharothrix deserti TaxID=2593674 RepID=UPI00131BFC39|nr:M56 family metallopeptidase [Saccharothrix deserti]
MTVAVALLLGAGLVAWLAPVHLKRLTASGSHPRVVLVAWLSSIASVVTTSGLAVTALLTPDHGAHAFANFPQCFDTLLHGSPPQVEALSGVVGVLLLAGLLVRLAVMGTRTVRRRARARAEHLAVLRLAARQEPGSPATLWLDHEEPLAFSLPGCPGVVVATEGLTRKLAGDQVDAVLVHERAHLRGRHHLLVTAADTLSAMLPFLPLFRQTPTAVRELVELAADAVAVRVCGAASVRAALTAVTSGGAPGSALAMSRDAVEARLAHLRHADQHAGRARTAVSCGVAGLTTMVLPPFVAVSGLLALVTVSCA